MRLMLGAQQWGAPGMGRGLVMCGLRGHHKDSGRKGGATRGFGVKQVWPEELIPVWAC